MHHYVIYKSSEVIHINISDTKGNNKNGCYLKKIGQSDLIFGKLRFIDTFKI